MKRLLILLFAASCLTATSQVPDYVPTDGLVAWYALDGDAVDFGPDQLDGLNVGAIAAQNRYGQASAAMYFDGQSVIELPSVNFPNGLTVSLWVKEDQITGVRGFLSKYDGDNGASGNTIERTFNLYRHNEGRGLKYYMTASSNGTAHTDVPSEAIGSTEWVHLVAMFGGETLQLFVNGEFDSSHPSGFTGSYFQSDVPLIVGGSYPISEDPNKLRGRVDDLGIWNRALTIEEIQGLYDAPQPSEGCTDVEACNYEESAILDDGSCLDCALFAERCGPGTLWDSETQMCIGDGSGDINLDGCVQLNDLLDLLSAYGNCGAEETPWQCGDPLEYQGYNYETVQIGDQCWFAENLRAENYRNGESIVYSGAASDWETNGYTGLGSRAAYNDDALLGALWGYIYNGFAVNDERALCPTGWIVPKNADWLELGEFLGGMSVAGHKMKNSPNDEFGWNGDNSSGFGGYATGDRHWPDGSFNHALDGSVGDNEQVIGLYWSGAPGSIPAQNYYALYEMDDQLTESSSNGPPLGFGAAVRCIKDTE